jgi:CheY-like chemotaxis protein
VPQKDELIKKQMQKVPLEILLADDDRDDRFLFGEALSEIQIKATLATVQDGEELMQYLENNSPALPDILFLDLNMPKKNGFECLMEIKAHHSLKQLPVIMFSTSYPRDLLYENDIISMLLKLGAQDYIRKPEHFSELKTILYSILSKAEKINVPHFSK